MQEDCKDYYSESEGDDGCCLTCSESEPGCLCYECKCSKCYWYTCQEDWNGEKGKCDRTIITESKKKSYAEQMQVIGEIKWKAYSKKREIEIEKENQEHDSFIKSITHNIKEEFKNGKII